MTDQIIYRDTITGQTVTAEYAKAHPDTTVRETRKAGKWRRRAEAAEAKLDAVRALHEADDPWCPCGHVAHDPNRCPDPMVTCAACGDDSPCPTIRAIDSAEEADQ